MAAPGLSAARPEVLNAVSSTLDKEVSVKLALHAVDNDVRELRAARGLSQAQLADAVSVSRQTINAIETGRYTPSLGLAIALARFFGRTVEEVFHVDSTA
jgi:putative transcriptional regulator